MNEQVQGLLKQISITQRLGIMGVAVAAVAMIGVLVMFASKPDYTPAFTNISATDATTIEGALRAADCAVVQGDRAGNHRRRGQVDRSSASADRAIGDRVGFRQELLQRDAARPHAPVSDPARRAGPTARRLVHFPRGRAWPASARRRVSSMISDTGRL